MPASCGAAQDGPATVTTSAVDRLNERARQWYDADRLLEALVAHADTEAYITDWLQWHRRVKRFGQPEEWTTVTGLPAAPGPGGTVPAIATVSPQGPDGGYQEQV